MAGKGRQAFDTTDLAAWNSHLRLLMAIDLGMSDGDLCRMFSVDPETLKAWRDRPLGYQPPKRGRKAAEEH